MAEHMRPEDKAEWNAAGVPWHKEALLYCIENYPDATWAAVDEEGHPHLLGGVTPVTKLLGKPWAVATPLMDKQPMAFCKIGRAMLTKLFDLHPLLAHSVDARNERHIAWLKWLGFEVGHPAPYGVNGELFHPFAMERPAGV